MIATTWGTGQFAYSLLWFFFAFIEIWLSLSIFIDIFRSHDMRGGTKAAWVILVIVFPIIGIVGYLIFRGDKMRVHQVEAGDYRGRFGGLESSTGRYAGPSPADEIAKLVELKNSGALSESEFERLKGHVIAQSHSAHSTDGNSSL